MLRFQAHKKTILFILLFIFILTNTFLSFARERDEKADIVFLKGNIYTLDPRHPQASALAVKGQYLLYVGDKDIHQYIDRHTKVVNLQGKQSAPVLSKGICISLCLVKT